MVKIDCSYKIDCISIHTLSSQCRRLTINSHLQLVFKPLLCSFCVDVQASFIPTEWYCHHHTSQWGRCVCGDWQHLASSKWGVWSDSQKMAPFWFHETIEASSSWLQSLPHAFWHTVAEMPCDIFEQWLSLHHPPIKLWSCFSRWSWTLESHWSQFYSRKIYSCTLLFLFFNDWFNDVLEWIYNWICRL